MVKHLLRPDYMGLYKVLLGLIVFGVGLTVFLFLISGQWSSGSVLRNPVYLYPAFAVLFVSIPLFLITMLVILRNTYYITDDELIQEEGIFNKTTRSLPIANIDRLEVQRSSLALMFDAATLCVYTKGKKDCEVLIRAQDRKEVDEIVHWLNKRIYEAKQKRGAEAPKRG